VISYPLSVVNFFVASGLIYIYMNRAKFNWNPPISATLPVVVIFALANLYLIVAPFVPPSDGNNVYETLPYWLHCVVGAGFLVLGAIYWLFWAIILPKIGGYTLVRETVIGDDGWSRNYFVRRNPDGSDRTTWF
jgi:hypothetical protein